MSNRASFVTQPIFCKECRQRLQSKFSTDWEWSIIGGESFGSFFAAKIRSNAWPMIVCDANMLAFDSKPCHEITFALIDELGRSPELGTMLPDGNVEWLSDKHIEKKEKQNLEGAIAHLEMKLKESEELSERRALILENLSRNEPASTSQQN